MADRYQLRRMGEPTVDRNTLGAHVNAALYSVLHDETLSEAEKVAAMRAIASLARGMSAHWRRSRRFYGVRLWHRLCGLGAEGNLSPEMLRRVAEVTSSVGERHIERGEN